MDIKKAIKLLQKQELMDLCQKHHVNPEKMLELVQHEKDKKILRRRVSISKIIGRIIKEEIEK